MSVSWNGSHWEMHPGRLLGGGARNAFGFPPLRCIETLPRNILFDERVCGRSTSHPSQRCEHCRHGKSTLVLEVERALNNTPMSTHDALLRESDPRKKAFMMIQQKTQYVPLEKAVKETLHYFLDPHK